MPEGWEENSLVHDSLTRWYRIYTPDPLPEDPALVVFLHGGTLSMRSLFSPLADSSATWFRIAEVEGVVLVVPNGVNPKTGDTYGDDQVWNDLRPYQAEGQSQVDDVGFILSLLDQISPEIPIDPDRIFVTGASNGGMMTYRLLIEAPERFAAGAAYIANLPVLATPIPDPAHPVPILIGNGTKDLLMPYEGGLVAKDRGEVISTEETVAWWVAANKADQDGAVSRILPDINQDDECRIHETIYPADKIGAPVRFYRMDGGGHTLPGIISGGKLKRAIIGLLGPVCQDADGVLLAWEFFQEVSLSTGP
jgi:polyhydroxybutyrate depolymerase